MYSARGSQKRVVDALELELWVVGKLPCGCRELNQQVLLTVEPSLQPGAQPFSTISLTPLMHPAVISVERQYRSFSFFSLFYVPCCTWVWGGMHTHFLWRFLLFILQCWRSDPGLCICMPGTLPLGNTLSVFVFNWTTLTPSLHHLTTERKSSICSSSRCQIGLERQTGHLVLHSVLHTGKGKA